MCKLTLLLVDEILLPRCMNCPTDFRDFLFNKMMAPSRFKHMKSVLFEHM